MKVLLTGASGFVGSHILDCLFAQGLQVKVLLRDSSSRQFLSGAVDRCEFCRGAVDDAQSLAAAMAGVTHVIHCAGATKALDGGQFYRVNQVGTRNVVEAANQAAQPVQRFVHISSLAASGPATSQAPARETEPPKPVSEYGRSKLAAEKEVTGACRVPWVILRPPGVYGPRDGEFLKLFKAVRGKILPCFGGGRQELSLVYVEDLASAAVHCLRQGDVVGEIFNVANPEVTTVRKLGEEVAALLKVRALPLSLPLATLWPICVLQEAMSQITRKPNVISRQKYAELAAAGWVCDVSRLKTEGGFTAATGLKEGLARTLQWYRAEGWLG